MNGEALAFAGTALVAICGLAGVLGASWISNRAAARQRAAQTAIDERKVDRDEFDSITRELRASLAEVRIALEHERAQRRLANEYARTLATVLRSHHMRVPSPPVGLEI